MPFVSDKQRRYMYSQKPDIAKKYEKEGKNYIKTQSAKRAIEDMI